MAIYIYTVESPWGDLFGVAAESGIRMNEITHHPELKRLIQGVVLELRFPDGSSQQTRLVNSGVGAFQQEDGSLLVESDPYLPAFYAARRLDYSSGD